jgi:hypothetical protein
MVGIFWRCDWEGRSYFLGEVGFYGLAGLGESILLGDYGFILRHLLNFKPDVDFFIWFG